MRMSEKNVEPDESIEFCVVGLELAGLKVAGFRLLRKVKSNLETSDFSSSLLLDESSEI